jgi:tRNA threonylcarbamoyladenosine biosynthesis protein TsaE
MKNMKKIIITTEKQTEKLAMSIAKSLKGGEVLALSGDLGAGKTTFTQYLSKALSVKQHVNSPTFVIMKIYKTGLHPMQHLVHVDAYRIENEEGLEDLGLDEYINHPHAVVVIEWAEKLKKYLKTKKKVKYVNLEIKGAKRVVTIK